MSRAGFSLRWALVGLLVATSAAGCVYPHRSTSLTSVRDRAGLDLDAPSDIFRLTIVAAQIRPRKRGNLAWDDNDGLPDAFVRVYRGEDLIVETEVVSDDLAPTWDFALPENVRIEPRDPLRIEVWDEDTLGSDPVGIMRRHGLPENAVPGVDARVLLEGGSYLTIRVDRPVPQRGVGISDYEVQPDALVIVSVLPYSPAGRAGLVPGDRIVGIGEEDVSAMNDALAASALSMASRRQSQLRVRDAEGHERTVDLDDGLVWPTR